MKRSAGRSATAAAAYRHGEKIHDERTDETHDYSKRKEVEDSFTEAPDNAPEWVHDRQKLWNEVEAVEKRKDAQVAREFEVSLPRELTPEARKELVQDFVKEQFVSRGMIADVAIHNPAAGDGQEQPHAHIMSPTRHIGPEGFGKKAREWNDKAVLQEWREAWGNHVNQALERHGIDQRVDHRSYKDQGLDRMAEPKMGPAATNMERKAEREAKRDGRQYEPVTRIGKERAEVKERNWLTETRDKINQSLAELGQTIKRQVTAVKDLVTGKREDLQQGANPPAPGVNLKAGQLDKLKEASQGLKAKDQAAQLDGLRKAATGLKKRDAHRDRLDQERRDDFGAADEKGWKHGAGRDAFLKGRKAGREGSVKVDENGKLRDQSGHKFGTQAERNAHRMGAQSSIQQYHKAAAQLMEKAQKAALAQRMASQAASKAMTLGRGM